MNQSVIVNKTSCAIVLITTLFFLRGFVLNLNPILIPHFKKACRLTNTQPAFIDSASNIAYFLPAIPAGKFMHRFAYRAGIIFGLLLFATGAFLFYPVATTRSYAFFLGVLFIIANGLAFLEIAANPYLTVLGDPATGTQSLNFAPIDSSCIVPINGIVFCGKKYKRRKPLTNSSTLTASHFFVIGTSNNFNIVASHTCTVDKWIIIFKIFY